MTHFYQLKHLKIEEQMRMAMLILLPQKEQQ
jgi:hypothetical protein